MNNKGQTLVLFVIIIPVISFLFICFYQVGMMNIDNKKTLVSIEEAFEYGLNNLDSEMLQTNVKKIIMESDKDIKEDDITVEIIGDELNIVVKKEYKTMVLDEEKIFNYTGRLSNQELEIIENRG